MEQCNIKSRFPKCGIKSRYPKLYQHIIEWDTTALRSYKYNLRILGEFYSWYLTRVCIEHDHVCDIDFIILPDEPFWDSASALIFNNLLEQRCKGGTTMNIDYHHRANGQCHNQIKDQWCEPNAEREFARDMLRQSPMTLEDYQGNVRAVIDGQSALEDVNNYYPYGALLGGNQGVQPYKYGTKELDRQNGLDWYDSRARMYDPVLGRTPTIDPKAEDYAPISPYVWCAGNPIFRFDLKGDNFYSINPTGYFTLLKETEHKN